MYSLVPMNTQKNNIRRFSPELPLRNRRR